MENRLRADLIDWLRQDPALLDVNAIEEESPLRATPPWIGLAASASSDWGTKDKPGREVRIALELESRTDAPAADAGLIRSIEDRVFALPPSGPGYELASVRFLRGRSEQRKGNRRATLLEFQFRLFHAFTE